MGTHIFESSKIEILPDSGEQELEGDEAASWKQAESVLLDLAAAFPFSGLLGGHATGRAQELIAPHLVGLPEVDARYRTLVEQIPAVVFMAFLDKGIGEAYVSPQIESMLGFSQEEWLNDPVRWYQANPP